MKLSNKTASRTHRILVYGGPKSGKSLLAGKLAAEYNLLWFDLENGADVLFQLPKEYQERIELISIPDTRSFPVAIETCLKVIKGVAGKVCETHGKWNCSVCAKDSAAFTEVELSTLTLDTIVVFDSLTQLTNSCIAHITKGKPDDYKLEYDDWGNLGKLMDVFLSHVQQAGFHVICISHETEAEMEDGKNKLVPTAGTRNFSRNAARYFDEVVYCEVKNKKHVAASSTLYNGNILTGSRTNSSIETGAEMSLLPIFKGTSTQPTSNVVNKNTPAHAAAGNLTGLAARLAAAKDK